MYMHILHRSLRVFSPLRRLTWDFPWLAEITQVLFCPACCRAELICLSEPRGFLYLVPPSKEAKVVPFKVLPSRYLWWWLNRKSSSFMKRKWTQELNPYEMIIFTNTYMEGWAPKNCFRTMVLEKTLESSLDNTEIKPVSPKGNQPWIFTEKTDTEAEAPIPLPPTVKSQLIGKDPNAGKDWEQEKKAAEDEMVGWYHWLNGHEFEQTPGDGEGQRSLVHACRVLQFMSCKKSHMTQWLNNNNNNMEILIKVQDFVSCFCLVSLFLGQTHWHPVASNC